MKKLLLTLIFLFSIFNCYAKEHYFVYGWNVDYDNNTIGNYKFHSINSTTIAPIVYGYRNKFDYIGFQVLGDFQYSFYLSDKNYSKESPFYVFSYKGQDCVINTQFQDDYKFSFSHAFSLSIEPSFVYYIDDINSYLTIGPFYDFKILKVSLENKDANKENDPLENLGFIGSLQNQTIGLSISYAKTFFTGKEETVNIGIKPKFGLFNAALLNTQKYKWQFQPSFSIELFVTMAFGKNKLYYLSEEEQRLKEEKEQRLKEEKLKYIQSLKDNPTGPFGVSWGMTAGDLKSISVEFDNYFYSFYQAHYPKDEKIHIFNFKTEKSVDEIENYYAIFDGNEKLFQVFTLCNYHTSKTAIDYAKGSQKNNEVFHKMINILNEQYGNPLSVDNEHYIWNKNDIKVELFKENQIVEQDNYGKKTEFYIQGVCLVYSDTIRQNKVHQRIQAEIEKQKMLEKEKIEKQKAYY